MTSSVRRLRSVAAEVKERTKSRDASITKPLTGDEELKDDAFKSCNGSSYGDNVVEAVPDTSVITVNRSWWAPPKSAALL